MNKQDQIKLLTAFLFGVWMNVIVQYALDTYALTQEQFFLIVGGMGVAIVLLWKNGGKHF